jgi:hypothetical protein
MAKFGAGVTLMPIDTMTIVLDGDVPLEEFARAIERFNELVKALSEEMGSPALDWMLDDLQISSAVATIRAENDPQRAEEVIKAYADIGDALAYRKPVLYSQKVQSAARNVVNIRDARVKAVRFETPIREVTIKTVPGEVIDFAPPEAIKELPVLIRETAQQEKTFVDTFIALAAQPSFGGIQGRIQALSNRGGLRFTLYDLLYDKSVGCYLSQQNEDLLRNIWGKMAVVEGMITRDPVTGRPLAIRQVSRITPLPEPYRTQDYMEARGCAPSLSGLSPEEAIRRIRDVH